MKVFHVYWGIEAELQKSFLNEKDAIDYMNKKIKEDVDYWFKPKQFKNKKECREYFKKDYFIEAAELY
jgi:hypothetical protein